MRPAVIGLAGPELIPAEAALLRALPPAGVILFSRNIVDPAQLAALVAALRDVLPAEAVLMVDQEGGRVARLRPPHWRAHPPAARLGALYAAHPAAGRRAAWLTGALIGAECRAAGFDVVCAPVADLGWPAAHEVIGDRAFAAAPATVAALAGAFAEGLLAAGVQPVVKHAPGHGRAHADSHAELPVVSAPESALHADLEPFRLLRHLPWMMTAHVCYPVWDARHPATLSAPVIGTVIRGRIGFAHLLVSDDLAMGALAGSPAERARAALAAGCDIVLHCAGELAASEAVLRACPPIGEATLGRLRHAAQRAGTSRQLLDPAALAAERDGLLA